MEGPESTIRHTKTTASIYFERCVLDTTNPLREKSRRWMRCLQSLSTKLTNNDRLGFRNFWKKLRKLICHESRVKISERCITTPVCTWSRSLITAVVHQNELEKLVPISPIVVHYSQNINDQTELFVYERKWYTDAADTITITSRIWQQK